jgi:hypothetical protein
VIPAATLPSVYFSELNADDVILEYELPDVVDRYT